MSLWTGFDASASGLTAERLRLDLIAANLANVDSAQAPGGAVYRQEAPVFAATPAGQVEVVGIVQDLAPLRVVHDPGNPLADANGNVRLPNVDVTAQMVDMLAATRAYEANASAIEADKQVFRQALNI
jgi:flagellar basal-body rod protein FlgC